MPEKSKKKNIVLVQMVQWKMPLELFEKRTNRFEIALIFLAARLLLFLVYAELCASKGCKNRGEMVWLESFHLGAYPIYQSNYYQPCKVIQWGAKRPWE